MPSGQYFFTDPTIGAVANNLAKVFFGDPAARTAQIEREGLMLDNTLRQRKIDTIDRENLGRASLGTLFGGFQKPEDIRGAAPALAQQSVISGYAPKDLASLALFTGANMGADTGQLGELFAGAGQTLNINEGVNIEDRNSIIGQNANAAMARQRAADAGALERTQIQQDTERWKQLHPGTVSPNLGETVFLLDENNQPTNTFVTSPEAVAGANKARGAKGTGAQAPEALSPSQVNQLRKYVLNTLPNSIGAADSPDNAPIIESIVTRAGQYIQAGYGADAAVMNAQRDVLAFDEQGNVAVDDGWFTSPRLVRSAKPNIELPLDRRPLAVQYPPANTGPSTLTGPPVGAVPTAAQPLGEMFMPVDSDGTGAPVAPDAAQPGVMSTQAEPQVPEGTIRVKKKGPDAGKREIRRNGQWIPINGQ